MTPWTPQTSPRRITNTKLFIPILQLRKRGTERHSNLPKVTQQVVSGMEIETPFPMPQVAYNRVEYPVGLVSEPRRQELQRLKPEALPFCLGALKAKTNSEEDPGLGINMEVGKGSLEPGWVPPIPIPTSRLHQP